MSDLEYDILDELYFLVHFDTLIEALGLSDDEIKPMLLKLSRKGWIRVYSEPEQELEKGQVDLEVYFRKYYFLISKEGLKAHTN